MVMGMAIEYGCACLFFQPNNNKVGLTIMIRNNSSNSKQQQQQQQQQRKYTAKIYNKNIQQKYTAKIYNKNSATGA